MVLLFILLGVCVFSSFSYIFFNYFSFWLFFSLHKIVCSNKLFFCSKCACVYDSHLATKGFKHNFYNVTHISRSTKLYNMIRIESTAYMYHATISNHTLIYIYSTYSNVLYFTEQKIMTQKNLRCW